MTPVTVSLVERPGREPKFRWIELSDGRRFPVRSTGELSLSRAQGGQSRPYLEH